MNYIELLRDKYYGYSVANNLERLRALNTVINHIDNELNKSNSDRDFISYMIDKRVEALQMSIELRMLIIINRHC